jgi:hypothetical protein
MDEREIADLVERPIRPPCPMEMWDAAWEDADGNVPGGRYPGVSAVVKLVRAANEDPGRHLGRLPVDDLEADAE